MGFVVNGQWGGRDCGRSLEGTEGQREEIPKTPVTVCWPFRDRKTQIGTPRPWFRLAGSLSASRSHRLPLQDRAVLTREVL